MIVPGIPSSLRLPWYYGYRSVVAREILASESEALVCRSDKFLKLLVLAKSRLICPEFAAKNGKQYIFDFTMLNNCLVIA